MKRAVLLLFVLTMVFGGVSAQKARKDSAFVKIIFNGRFKFLRGHQADTTVLIRKDGKWFFQRNGEMLDTLDFATKKKVEGEKKVETKIEVKVDKDGKKKVDTIKVVKIVEPKEHRFHGHWSGVEFGLNTLLSSSGSMSLPTEAKLMELNTSRSWAFHWNIFKISAPIYKNNIGLVTGLGTDFNNYNFKGHFAFNTADDTLSFNQDLIHSFEKNKLFIWYLTVPLLLEFQVHKGESNHTSFFFSCGAIGSLKLLSRQKHVYTNDQTYINSGDFYINPLKLDLTARVGNSWFELFGNYSVISLFQKGKGPEVMPLTVGLGLLF